MTLPEVWGHPSLRTPGDISHMPTPATGGNPKSLLPAPANKGNAQPGLRDLARTGTQAAGQVWGS